MVEQFNAVFALVYIYFFTSQIMKKLFATLAIAGCLTIAHGVAIADLIFAFDVNVTNSNSTRFQPSSFKEIWTVKDYYYTQPQVNGGGATLVYGRGGATRSSKYFPELLDFFGVADQNYHGSSSRLTIFEEMPSGGGGVFHRSIFQESGRRTEYFPYYSDYQIESSISLNPVISGIVALTPEQLAIQLIGTTSSWQQIARSTIREDVDLPPVFGNLNFKGTATLISIVDTNNVPEPNVVYLLAIGIVVITAMRRHREKSLHHYIGTRSARAIASH